MKEFFIGLILGLGKVIPGLSGSVLAISFNVYDKAIYAFNNLKDLKNIIFLTKLGIGIIISVIFASNLIIYFLNNYKVETTFLFIGLILGSKEEINKNTKAKYFYLSIISFILISLMSLIRCNSSIIISNNILLLFISGIVESLSSIIPGISGTALLMLIGTYDKVIYIFSNIININYIINNLFTILPFIIGIILGLIVSVKLINYLFINYLNQMYNIILGLLYGSIFVMLINLNYSIYHLINGIILLILGSILIKKVNHFL